MHTGELNELTAQPVAVFEEPGSNAAPAVEFEPLEDE